MFDWLTDLEVWNSVELTGGVTHTPLYYSPDKGLYEGPTVKQYPSVLQTIRPNGRRLVLTYVGKPDPQGLAQAIRGDSRFNGLVPVTSKPSDDGGTDVVFYDWETIVELLGDPSQARFSLKQLNAVDAMLRRKVNPKFTGDRSYRVLIADNLGVDGCVLLMKDLPHSVYQVTLFKTIETGVSYGAKGTMVRNDESLTGIKIPEGYDGILNLAEFKVNGFSLKEAPATLRTKLEEALPVGSGISVCEGVDLFITRPIRLNIRVKGLSASISMFWDERAREAYIQSMKRQAESLIEAKAKARNAEDVNTAVRKHLPLFGVSGDALKLSLKLGGLSPEVAAMVPALFAAAGVRLISQGAVFKQAFTTVMPSPHLQRGEIALPSAAWQALFGNKPFTPGRHVDMWRNPQLPGVDNEGRLLTAGTFVVKALSEGEVVYVNRADWETMGGDFDGDPVNLLLAKPMGLKGLSPAGLRVQKDKTSQTLRPLADVVREVIPNAFGSLAAKLGVVHGLVTNLLDQAYAAGRFSEVLAELGFTGADFIQACVITQKHRAIYTDPQGEIWTSDGVGGRKLTFEYMQSVLEGIAARFGLSCQPTSALELHKLFRKSSFAVRKAPIFLDRIPDGGVPLKGYLAEVLTLLSRLNQTQPGELEVNPESLKSRILAALRRQLREFGVKPTVPMGTEEMAQRKAVVRNFVAELRKAQATDPDYGWTVDSLHGVPAFYYKWSQYANGTLRSERSAIADLYRRICMMGWAIEAAVDDWEAVRILAADYRLFTAVCRGVSAETLQDINPANLAQREE
jgi:hypothetical protein